MIEVPGACYKDSDNEQSGPLEKALAAPAGNRKPGCNYELRMKLILYNSGASAEKSSGMFGSSVPTSRC